ncbi:hypothetical protein F2P81_008985 [Scophthalmus maximus]|uniref:BTB/POZ domain-containing protein KCTD16-like n=1 Tax=Scophthalmus maximus TaxID=52904 RepID=A0A6A4T5W4_SCOMX|nr:hypothetical protein F2P81_008985 [Scophthalmus maximus]
MTKKDTDLLYHEKTNKREVVNINGNSVSTGGLVGVQRGLRQTDQSGTSRWSSPPCDCCCKNHKGDGEGESGTSFNELSTSSSESQSEASSPQGTIICGPVSRQPHAHVQTLDRPLKKGPVAMLQQSDQRRKSDLLRTLTASSRDTSTCKKRPAKEKLTAEEELDKCIQDFRKIKIPERFPERKYMWQADLLRKYRL